MWGFNNGLFKFIYIIILQKSKSHLELLRKLHWLLQLFQLHTETQEPDLQPRFATPSGSTLAESGRKQSGWLGTSLARLDGRNQISLPRTCTPLCEESILVPVGHEVDPLNPITEESHRENYKEKKKKSARVK